MALRNRIANGWTWATRAWMGLPGMVAALLGSVNLLALEPPTPPAASGGSPTNMPVRQVSPGVFEIGKIRLDKTQRTIRFPAVLNMNDGVLEYLLVTSYGKTHESLLRTDAEPYQIHLALLLLGAQAAGTNALPENPAQPLPGDRVTVELSWNKGSRERRRAAEECVYNRRTRSAMTKGPWAYTGSQIFEGTFIAQRDGSIISLITDPDALINNPRPGREDDENWLVNKAGLPPLNSPVQVTIKLVR